MKHRRRLCDCAACRAARRPRFRVDAPRVAPVGAYVRVHRAPPLVRVWDGAWVRSLRTAPEGVPLLAALRCNPYGGDGARVVVRRCDGGALRVAVGPRWRPDPDPHHDAILDDREARALIELSHGLAPPGEREPSYLTSVRVGGLEVYADGWTGRIVFAFDYATGEWVMRWA